MRRRTLGLALFVALVLVASGTAIVGGEASSAPDQPVNGTYEAGGGDIVHAVVPAEDGYLLVGEAVTDHGSMAVDGWVVRVDENGTERWRRTFGGDDSDVLFGGVRTDDGFLLVGTHDASNRHVAGEYWALKLTSDGNREWSETYGEGRFHDAVRTPDGNVLVVGGGYEDGGRVLTVAPNGTTLADRSYGSASFAAVERDGDGYVFAGHAGRAVAVDHDGDVRWERTHATGASWFRDVTATTDGGYLFVGRTPNSSSGEYASWLVRTDRSGTVLWNRTVGAPSGTHWTYGAATGPNGSAIVVGKTIPGSGWAMRVDRDGSLGERRREGTVLYDVRAIGDGFYLLAGSTDRTHGGGRIATFDVRPPTVAVEAVPAEAEVGQTTVNLSAAGSTDNLGIAEYRWDFDGDGAVDRTTDGSNVTHVYAEPGTFEPTVTAVDRDGNAGTAATTVTAVDTTPPVPALASPENGLVAADQATRLNASASDDDHEIVEYRWDFDGDGTVDETTRESVARHRYAGVNRTHELVLTVVDASGNENESTFELRSVENDRPNASADASLPVVGRETFLTASVEDRVGTITVTWEFPNGSRSTGERVSYVFEDGGTHEVTVVAEDEYGARNETVVTVDVLDEYPSDVVRAPMFAIAAGVALIAFVVLLAVVGALLPLFVRGQDDE